MTVGANVKGCYFAMKSAEATLSQLAVKTNVKEAKLAYERANQIVVEVKTDLEKQITFITNEEPQYK